MISLVLYGRNDSYGYNLHKRAALSLNCMAEVLTSSTDEILFVDYNTPDDYPTFPEAIQDTLTERAKQMLRIFRVRPSVHARFAHRSKLVALEPIARNVAVRRSNSANRWVLSTNTDMIFVPHEGLSLSDQLVDLPDGFYHLPRFEIPETLWEMFDRKDAVGTINRIRPLARAAHLNEIVELAPYIRFDAPGDFQLIQRNDLFRIHGFDEDMLLGWHVDSNIAKRLHLLLGSTGDLLDKLYGYHCDHTRQVTPMHRPDSATNDFATFVENVTIPEMIKQATSWGCADDEIEEIRLDRTRNSLYLDGLKAVIKSEMTKPTTVAYSAETYDRVTYSPSHVLPFLADIFVNVPARTTLAWIGGNPEMFGLFANLWHKMEIGGPILVYEKLHMELGKSAGTLERLTDLDEMADHADAFIFEYPVGTDDVSTRSQNNAKGGRLAEEIKLAFFDLLQRELLRLETGKAPRRFVVVNAIHNGIADAVNSFIGVARTPFSTRIRQGFVAPRVSGPIDWTPRMLVAYAGKRVDFEIMAPRNSRGHIMHGPHASLFPGKYRVTASLKNGAWRHWRSFLSRSPDVLMEVVAGKKEFARRRISTRDIKAGRAELEFNISLSDVVSAETAGIDVRIWTKGRREFSVGRVIVDEI